MVLRTNTPGCNCCYGYGPPTPECPGPCRSTVYSSYDVEIKYAFARGSCSDTIAYSPVIGSTLEDYITSGGLVPCESPTSLSGGAICIISGANTGYAASSKLSYVAGELVVFVVVRSSYPFLTPRVVDDYYQLTLPSDVDCSTLLSPMDVPYDHTSFTGGPFPGGAFPAISYVKWNLNL